MSSVELLIWGMATGAIGTVVLFGAAELVLSRSAAAAEGTAYHMLALLFVFLLSGLSHEVLQTVNQQSLQVAQVLIGPVCSGLGNHWIRDWLAADQRDRMMEAGLRFTAWATPAAGLLCLLLPVPQQLPAAAGICLLSSVLALWLAVRAWLFGDRLALGMAIGCALMLPPIAGLYAMAMGTETIGSGWQAVLALSAVLCNTTIGVMLWLRNRHHQKTRGEEAGASQFDPVTKLHSGIALVQKLIKAQRRRRRTRRDGAVLAVLLFDLDRLSPQVSPAGMNELYIHLAARIQRQVGVVNPVGRYYDRCFITLVETIHSPAWLRTLGLRVASSLRRPVEVTALDGQRIEVRADVGVGVVHLSRDHADVEDILHDAQRMAEAARGMRSRAAMLDPQSGELVPVELANLGPRRHGHPGRVPHASPVKADNHLAQRA